MGKVNQILNNGNTFTYVVDPNPTGRDYTPTEDLVMYTELTAYTQNRSIINNNSNFINEDNAYISFITSTKINDGNYLTTNYSRIGANQKVEESFGIKKIDIKINASQVPQVNIIFEDSRGAAIFNDYEAIDNNGRITNSSKFNVFFKLPYPIFKLTVKGYYGSAVSYCLHLKKWQTNFNPENGNYEIYADFIGYNFAFLTDILMKNVLACCNSPEGLSKLQQTNTLPLTTLFSNFGQLSRLTESFKKTNTDYLELVYINSALTKINEIQQKIGLPLNDLSGIITNGVNINNVDIPTNLIFIRDVGILNATYIQQHNNFFNEINELVLSYNDLVRSNNLNGNLLITEFNIKTPLVNYALNNVGLNALHELIQQNETSFDTTRITTQYIETQMKIKDTSNFSFVLLNYYEVRKVLTDIKQKLEDTKKSIEINVNNELNKEIENNLGFNPTIESVIKVICDNVDAFLSVIYDYAVEAENLGTLRTGQLNSINTDNVDNTIYPFPLVANDSGEQLWLGDVVGENNPNFPEIRLVNLILNNYFYIQNQIEQTNFENNFFKSILSESLDWFPISILDSQNNELSNINTIQLDGNIIPQQLLDIITNRYNILTNISKIPVNSVNNINLKQLTTIAELEGAYLADSLVTQQLKDYYKNLNISDFTDSFIDNIVINTSNNLNNLFIIDGYIFNNTELKNIINNKNNNFTPSIVNILNGKNLNSTINETRKSYHTNLNSNNNFIYRDYTILGWDNNSIVNIKRAYELETGVKYNTTRTTINPIVSNVKDLKFIEGLIVNSFDNGNNSNPYENNNNQRIGRNFLKLEYSNLYSIFDTPEYLNSNNYGKCLLFLKTFNFDIEFDNFINEISSSSQIAIVNVPYFLWICGNIYRSTFLSEQGVDIIESDLNLSSSFNNEFIPIDTFFSEVFDTSQYTNEFLVACSQIFQDFVDNYYITGEELSLEATFQTYSKLFENNSFNLAGNYQLYKDTYNILLEFTTSTFKLGIINPQLIKPTTVNITQSNKRAYFKSLFKSFLNNIDTKLNENLNLKNNQNNSLVDDKDLKIELYYHLKNLYDKWLAFGSKDGKIYTNCAYNPNKSLFDYFHFVDRAWNYIGDRAVLNPQTLMSLSSNINISLSSFFSRLFRDSKFIFHMLPTYVNYYNLDDVKKMFEPTLEVKDVSQGSTFVCVYTGGNSKVLDLNDGVYVNDGFDLRESFSNNIPKDFKSRLSPNRFNQYKEEEAKYNLGIFRVAYADQNQNIFKKINVGQQNIRETSESLMVQSELFDTKGGSTKRFYKGVDLYPMYSLRSYECNVEAMGNMQILPLQYFQLDNIPLFHGAYKIINVNHTITPNNVTTSFKGYRMSKYAYPIVDDITSFIKLPLNETQSLQLGNFNSQNWDGDLSNGFDNTGLNNQLVTSVEDSTRVLFSFVKNNTQYEYKLIDELNENNVIDKMNNIFLPNTQNMSTYGLGSNLCYAWVKNAIADIGIVQTPPFGVNAWDFFANLGDRRMYYINSVKDKGFSNIDLQNAGVKNGSFVFGFYNSSLYKDDATDAIKNAPNNANKIANLTQYRKKVLSNVYLFNPITHVAIFYNGIYYDLIKGKIFGQPTPSFYPIAYYHFLPDLLKLSSK